MFQRLLAAQSNSKGVLRTTELVNKNPELVKKWMADCPVGRLCKVWELKGVYVFLASGASSYVTGADYVVDGKLVPIVKCLNSCLPHLGLGGHTSY